MSLRKLLVSFIVLGVVPACGSLFPQAVVPVGEVHVDAGSMHMHGINILRTELGDPNLRPCHGFGTHQDGGVFDAGVDAGETADAGLVVQTTPSDGGGVVFEPGSRSVLRFVVNRVSVKLPATCTNPGFEIWSQVMEGSPPRLASVVSYRTGFETDVQIVQEANSPVFSKFFCQLDGGAPISVGGDFDPACYTASIPEFFSELALYDLDGGVTDMRVQYRSITYLGKVRVSDTPARVVPATSCLDGGQ